MYDDVILLEKGEIKSGYDVVTISSFGSRKQ
jgi:hypothetical protein